MTGRDGDQPATQQNPREYAKKVLQAAAAGTRLSKNRAVARKHCELLLMHKDDPNNPDSETFERYLKINPGDEIRVIRKSNRR